MNKNKVRRIGDYVPLSDLPKVTIDYNGLADYIRKNNKSGEQLSDDELQMFISGNDDWKQFRASFVAKPVHNEDGVNDNAEGGKI